MWFRYGRDSVSRFKTSVGEEIEMTSGLDGSKTRLPVTADPKALLGMLMQACFLVPPDGSAGPTASECEIIVAEDTTKVSFIGPRRQRADRIYAGYSDIGAPDGSVFQLKPSPLRPENVPLLQLADIAAYLCSHSHGDDEAQAFFREELKKVKFWWRVGY